MFFDYRLIDFRQIVILLHLKRKYLEILGNLLGQLMVMRSIGKAWGETRKTTQSFFHAFVLREISELRT